jgi:hypothetical protein
MATTYTKIADYEVGVLGAADITFSIIPSTYTDLVLKVSLRSTLGGDYFLFSFNNTSANFSSKYTYWENTSVSSSSLARYGGRINTTYSTASTFASSEIYIPNYAGSAYKSYSSDSVSEGNTAAAPGSLVAGLWSDTSAINQISVLPSAANFAQFSTATLYGVKKS